MAAASGPRPVLVTGACGRLGSQVARRLLEDGHRVLATDRAPAPADPAKLWGSHAERVEFVQADLLDVEAVESLAARCGPAVHVGAIPGPSGTPPPGVAAYFAKEAPIGLEPQTGVELLRQNLIGTCILFEALTKQGDGRRVVFSSSLFSMGWSHDPCSFQPRYLPLDEEQPPEPLEHYGLSKAFAESFSAMLVRVTDIGTDEVPPGPPSTERQRLTKADFVGPSFVSLRFSNVIKAEKWNELPWPAPTKCVTPLLWAYCHEHDVVEAHMRALALPQEALASRNETFILAAEDTRYDLPTTELIARHWQHAGKPAPFFSQGSLEGFTSLVCSDKARRVLGLSLRSFRSSSGGPAASLGTSGRSWSVFKAPAGFLLKGGQSGAGLEVAYQTYGLLDADRSNVVLHPTSFDAVHWELEYNVGPGKVLDTAKHFVVIVNLLGAGVSSSPSSCSSENPFPSCGTSVCDNVRLQALLLDSLGIGKLKLIYGYSMGAMQAIHWAAMFPERVQRVAAVCGSAKVSDFNIVFLDSLEAALLADQDCRRSEGRIRLTGPCKQGLKAFARIYAGWGVSQEFYRKELWRGSSRDGVPFKDREDFVARSYEGGFAASHPLNLLAQINTWRTADVSQATKEVATLAQTLKRITARVYLMPGSTDTYFSAADIEAESRLIPNCRFAPIES
ncbi:unnamed protein product, partial [Polarella glacialis]